MSFLSRPASRIACSNGPRHESSRSLVSSWNFEPREREVEVQRTVAGCRDERQVHGGLLQRRQLDLRLLRGFLEPLHGHLVGTEVDTVRVLELGDEPVDDALVPVVTAEVGVPRGRLHLEDTLAEVEDRHVERATPEVEHEDRLVEVTFVEAVRQRRGSRLVDDAQHLETGDLTGLLRGLALGVAEVGGHRDHGLGDAVAEVRLGVTLELAQDASRDLLGVVGLPVDVDRPVRAHMPLYGADRAIRIRDRLTLRDLADEDLAGFREGDDRRSGARPLRIGDDDGLARLENRDDRVGGAEVDADGLGHGDCLLCVSGVGLRVLEALVRPDARTLSVPVSTFGRRPPFPERRIGRTFSVHGPFRPLRRTPHGSPAVLGTFQEGAPARGEAGRAAPRAGREGDRDRGCGRGRLLRHSRRQGASRPARPESRRARTGWVLRRPRVARPRSSQRDRDRRDGHGARRSWGSEDSTTCWSVRRASRRSCSRASPDASAKRTRSQSLSCGARYLRRGRVTPARSLSTSAASRQLARQERASASRRILARQRATSNSR